MNSSKIRKAMGRYGLVATVLLSGAAIGCTEEKKAAAPSSSGDSFSLSIDTEKDSGSIQMKDGGGKSEVDIKVDH